MHHVEAVNHYWKDESKLDFSEIDMELCHFAKEMTVNPNQDNVGSIAKLKALGLDDRAILDARLVLSYFNIVNRIVLGFGLAVSEEELVGYKYE